MGEAGGKGKGGGGGLDRVRLAGGGEGPACGGWCLPRVSEMRKCRSGAVLHAWGRMLSCTKLTRRRGSGSTPATLRASQRGAVLGAVSGWRQETEPSLSRP